MTISQRRKPAATVAVEWVLIEDIQYRLGGGRHSPFAPRDWVGGPDPEKAIRLLAEHGLAEGDVNWDDWADRPRVTADVARRIVTNYERWLADQPRRMAEAQKVADQVAEERAKADAELAAQGLQVIPAEASLGYKSVEEWREVNAARSVAADEAERAEAKRTGGYKTPEAAMRARRAERAADRRAEQTAVARAEQAAGELAAKRGAQMIADAEANDSAGG